LGKGSYGVVYQAQVLETGEIVAVKSIRMTEKDREIQILKELDGHPNIVCLKGAFLSPDVQGAQKLNLVLEFLSDTLHRIIKHCNVLGRTLDMYYVKLYLYQLLRGLAYVHGHAIMHCDIKPQNLLMHGKTHTLKLCDFGTAKRPVFGEQMRPYVCSRYYRAPELVLGCTNYTTAIDLWSAGCVFGEMVLGQPMFTGKDGIDQLVEIMKVLGTPRSQELRAMNPNYPDHVFSPTLPPLQWDRVFRGWTSEDANVLAGQLLRYEPLKRQPPLHCLLSPFFDVLRARDTGQPWQQLQDQLFDFREDELVWLSPAEREQLKGTVAAR